MSRYSASYKGVGQMIRSEFMRAAMLEQAERVKEDAERIAPVYVPGPHPGRYARGFGGVGGFHTTSARTGGGRKRDRAYGRCYNDAPEAFFVEWGTKNNDRHRTLGKALGLERDV